MDRRADALVGRATTDVARHRMIDVGVGRLGLLLQQGGRRHDLSRLAVAALYDVEVHPRLLHRLRCARRQAFDRRYLAIGNGRDRRRARAQRLSVDVDGAGAALRDATPVLGAGEAELLANDPQQWRIRITVELATRAVDVERDGHAKLLVSRKDAGAASV